MRCKEHPRYLASRAPTKTVRHPEGCPTCVSIWHDVLEDPKQYASTVTVEMLPDEARRFIMVLGAAIKLSEPRVAAMLRPVYALLVRETKKIL